MTYEECVCASKSGLKHSRMPNHEIITSPGDILFWEIIQCTVNTHHRNICAKDWDANDTMSVVTDDDEHHLNCKIPADNLRFSRHVRDNRLGMVNHAVTLTGTKITSRNDHEKHSESTTIVFKR